MDRRTFLKLSIGAALVLGVSGTSIRWIHRARRAPEDGFQILRPQDRVFFAALLPIILAGHENFKPHLHATLQSLDSMLLHSSPAIQKQVYDLTDLATFSVTRGMTTGVWRDWSEVTSRHAAHFLDRWRHSRIGLFRQGYQGICQLCQMAWYGLPHAWDTVGYPGPPDFLEVLHR